MWKAGDRHEGRSGMPHAECLMLWWSYSMPELDGHTVVVVVFRLWCRWLIDVMR